MGKAVSARRSQAEIPLSQRQGRRRAVGGQGETGQTTRGSVRCLVISFEADIDFLFRRVPGLKIRTGDPVNLPRPETMVHPKDTVQKIRDTIEAALSRQRDLDHHWEDLVDVSFGDLAF